VNCGAVGQPRDGDSRAAYGMLDTEARTLTIMRTVYNLALAQSKIVDAACQKSWHSVSPSDAVQATPNAQRHDSQVFNPDGWELGVTSE
jgi:diadenosine tetraphosphatase ApaH/serine/threonine PP2A family protein phosphatase